jgi:hypothetical protein
MGNVRLQWIVEEKPNRYNACSSNQEETGRFLTQESGVWIEASDAIAREKVSNPLSQQEEVPIEKVIHEPAKQTHERNQSSWRRALA